MVVLRIRNKQKTNCFNFFACSAKWLLCCALLSAAQCPHVQVEQVGTWAMIIPFGSLALAAGIVVILLIPETMGRPLPETIEEIEQKQSVHDDEMVTISTNGKEKSAEQ